MAKFSTKKLGKQIDKWTSGYYSSGYKSTNKSMSNSSFWINEDFLQDIPKGADYIRLAGYKRAISNFVRIVTGKDNIPVVYQATGNSYTDGKTVVISSKLDENQFDPTVGLALHEGSHIALSNFKVIHSDIAYVVENELSAWYTQTIGELKNYSDWCYHNRELLKDILNVIEDRRIDKFVYDSAPGYQGYYQSMYDTYFNAPIIDRALIDNLKISRSEEDYMFHIAIENFTTPYYMSEKVLNCFICSTMPIYWGCQNIGNYIIFSDATLFINKHNVDHISTFFDSYKKYDITFADNTGFGYHYNIGIMLIRCTNEMLYYFTTILDNIKITNGWDQAVINQTIIRTPFSIGCFDSTKIHCGDNFNTNYKNDFLIYKSFIKHTNNPIDNYNERFKTFLIAGLIDKEEYDKAIK